MTLRGDDRGPRVQASADAGTRERVRLLVELSRPKDAVELARKARARGDQSAELDELEGLAHIRLGDHEAALEALYRGLRTSPSRPHLHYLRSFSEKAKGRLSEATDALLEALRLAPEEPVYLRAYAELLSDQKQHEKALEIARAAVKAGPDRSSNFVSLGFVASSAGDKKLARESYEKALALDPEDATAWNNLGCLELDEGKGLSAREKFRESLRLAPEGARAKKNLDQTLTNRMLDGFVTFDDFVHGLGKELAMGSHDRLLIALALEAAPEAKIWGLVRKTRTAGRIVGFAIPMGMLAGLGSPTILGAGLAATFLIKRSVAADRRRVLAALGKARPEFAVIRTDWLEGRKERDARDLAARRLLERTTIDLCAPKETT